MEIMKTEIFIIHMNVWRQLIYQYLLGISLAAPDFVSFC